MPTTLAEVERGSDPGERSERGLYSLARELYGEHGHSDACLTALVDRVLESPDLTAQAVRAAALDAVLKAQQAQRNLIERQALTRQEVPESPRYSPSLRSALLRRGDRYLDWPMMDGSRLGDATKEHLLKDSSHYQVQSEANARHARFLTLVATKVRGSQRVRDRLDDQALADLMGQAERGE